MYENVEMISYGNCVDASSRARTAASVSLLPLAAFARAQTKTEEDGDENVIDFDVLCFIYS